MEIIKPYEATGSKKQQVSAMFNNIAKRYDLLNRVLSLGVDVWWRRRAIRLLRPDAPETLLDVATGTADVAMAAARALPLKKIVGIDISAQMLAFGRQKIARQALHDIITLEEGDCENLRFGDNTFDAVTVAFGVRNFEHLEKGLAEMRRVLKPNGQLVILEFSKPSIFPFKQIFNAYFRYILPTIGKFTSKDPKAYTYLYESVQAFPDGKRFLTILGNTGFRAAKVIPLTLGICSIYSARKS